MADVRTGRQRAQIDGDFVVFLIGARPQLTHPLRTFRDLGGRRGMRHMLEYLVAHPEKGLLSFRDGAAHDRPVLALVRSPRAFARDDSDPHSAVWRNYWKRVGKDNRTGIWHETY